MRQTGFIFDQASLVCGDDLQVSLEYLARVALTDSHFLPEDLLAAFSVLNLGEDRQSDHVHSGGGVKVVGKG